MVYIGTFKSSCKVFIYVQIILVRARWWCSFYFYKNSTRFLLHL